LSSTSEDPLVSPLPWPRNRWLATIVVGLAVWALYALVGPGEYYFRCYTRMVSKPERLPQVVEFPWTQNPRWLAPFMAPFVSLPGRPGCVAFMGFTIAAIIYACYRLGGKPIPVPSGAGSDRAEGRVGDSGWTSRRTRERWSVPRLGIRLSSPSQGSRVFLLCCTGTVPALATRRAAGDEAV